MSRHFHTPDGDASADDGRDHRLGAALESLDPGAADPGYWHRFHMAVMAAARDELARRQMLADLTVGDLVTSWARMLVPTAVLAAALASLLLLRPGGPGAPVVQDVPVALDELLREELGDATGAVLGASDDDMGVTFASGSF